MSWYCYKRSRQSRVYSQRNSWQNASLGDSTITILCSLCISLLILIPEDPNSLPPFFPFFFWWKPKFQEGFVMILYTFETSIRADRPCKYMTHSLICGSSASFRKTLKRRLLFLYLDSMCQLRGPHNTRRGPQGDIADPTFSSAKLIRGSFLELNPNTHYLNY